MNIKNSKFILRRAIQVAMAGSMLVSGVASAVLQDHGPRNPVITFPDWYRDTEGLALGLCTSTTNYCFPLAANPEGFPGNIGDEAFYNLVEFKSTATGSDFQYRYLGALEASYLPGPTPTPGQETVFARIRITFNFNDPNKNGTYVVTHPFGVKQFDNVVATTKTNLIGSQAANFFTVDVPLGNDFEGPLQGPVGPFIKWDTDYPIIAGDEEFVGDPTVLHTFTGSPFGTNYLEIQGPAGSNLDGLNPTPVLGVRTDHDTIKVDLATVLGQKWTAPIAQPLKVDSAVKTRSATTNGIDVWATSSPNQEVIVTGPGMPSLELFPSTVPGKYHGHIEYPSSQAVPEEVTVTNLSSKPVVSATAGLVDVVEISQATFDTTSTARKVTVVAHTSDNKIQPDLSVEGIPGVASGLMTTEQCAGLTVASNEVCYTTTLAASIEPPAHISVFSSSLGTETDHVLQQIGGAQNADNPPVSSDVTCKVGITGAVNLTATNCGTALPVDGLITELPLNSTLTHNTTLGANTWTFTPTVNTFVAPLYAPVSFKYVRQSAANAPVSNEATVTLAFVPATPTLLSANNVTDSSFTLNWGASKGATSYVVTKNGVAQSPIISTDPLVAPPTTTSITAPAGTSTAITVSACNLNGTNCSLPSTTFNQFTLPATPKILDVNGITNITSTGMTVNWGAVTGATGYSLQYSTNGGADWFNVGAANAASGVKLSNALTGASISANITGLANGTSYVFRVLATDPAGNSGYSAQSAVATTLIPPPAVPTLTAANVSGVTTTSFTVTFSPVNTATSYKLTANGVTTTVNPTNPLANVSIPVTGLASGTSYSVSVVACNQGGASCSAPSTVTQYTIAVAPTGLTLSNVTDTGLTLAWTGNAQSFKVQRATNSTFTTGLVTTSNIAGKSTAITGLTANTTYYFRVIGVANVGSPVVGTDGAASATSTQLTLLPVPGNVKGQNGATGNPITAGLSWDPVTGATSYEVNYNNTLSQSLGSAGTTVTATSNQQLTVNGGLLPTNTMRVRAKSANNVGVWSAFVGVTAR